MPKKSFQPSSLHQWALQRLLKAKGRRQRWFYERLRKALLRFSNPTVVHRLDGAELLLPASHTLPIFQTFFPDYDRALPRLVSYLSERGKELVVIDIGANVGDTAIALLQNPDVFVIAVDGNPAFTAYLRENLKNYPDRSFVAEAFVGDSGQSQMAIENSGGTAKLVPSASGGGVEFRSLSAILADAGKSEIGLIKIDTDGFDIAVIKSSLDLIKAASAPLFFEFDPALFLPNSPDGWSIFETLADLGYDGGIVYLNTGQYLRTINIAEQSAISDLKAFLASAEAQTYLDIMLFKSQKIFNDCAQREQTYFTGASVTETIKQGQNV